MLGMAVATMVPSMAAMNIASTRAASTRGRRVRRPAGAAAGGGGGGGGALTRGAGPRRRERSVVAAHGVRPVGRLQALDLLGGEGELHGADGGVEVRHLRGARRSAR